MTHNSDWQFRCAPLPAGLWVRLLGGGIMSEYSKYFDKWLMREVVPYLLNYHFRNKPTSNKDLTQGFWTLMGKDVEIGGKKRWTTGKTGVPYHIHRLTNEYILAEVPTDENLIGEIEYREYVYSYVLGTQGEKEIENFLGKYPKGLINLEISKYLDQP